MALTQEIDTELEQVGGQVPRLFIDTLPGRF